MKWLIDAQLPRRLPVKLNFIGHDSIHTLDLLEGNESTDAEINRIAAEAGRIIISNDRDFLDSHLVTELPQQLLWVTVGNISNIELMALFESSLSPLESAFQQSACVEFTQDGLMIHS